MSDRLEVEEVFHAQEAAVVFYKFGCEDCTKRKAAAVLRIMSDGDGVGNRVVAHCVDSGDLVATDGIYFKLALLHRSSLGDAAVGIGEVRSPIAHADFLSSSARMPSARVIAVPLGASSL